MLRKLLTLAAGAIFALNLTAVAKAQDNIGGHIGFVIPWATHADGQTTTIFDNYTFGFPIGVTFKGTEHMNIDLEMIPFISQKPKQVTLTVDPGIVWSVSHGVGVGIRTAFNVNSSSWGFIPLVNKTWKFKQPVGLFKAYFAEVDLPIQFSRPTGGIATNSVTFATHFGLGF
ncbi:MAG TPA: hypothetical protein VKY85_27870 [Candidatus Angelobacter sp.]|nr:hypothetical protein [Candidatus Angelobacter sp.]